MKDMVGEIGAEAVPDPMRVAGQGAKAALPKRFYERAESVATDTGYELRLDGRPARTPGRSPLAVRSPRVGEAIAAEWEAQTERIDPITMPVTRTANSAIDGVAPRMAEVRADVAAFAGSDLLCYRADSPEGLVQRQSEAWDPVLERFASERGARFALQTGIMPIEQPPEALAAIAARLDEIDDPLTLAALHVATTLTGSALLAIAVLDGWLDADAAWAAAHVDEDWNIALWGEDEEAAARRAQRWRDMKGAGLVLRDGEVRAAG